MSARKAGGGLAEPLLDAGGPHEPGAGRQSGTPLSAAVNLAASAMGTGVLTLPFAAARCGPLRYLLLLGVLSATTDVTLVLMVCTGRQLKLHSLGAVVRKLFGTAGSWIFALVMATVLFLALTAMQRVVLDLLPMFLEELCGLATSSLPPVAVSLVVNAGVFSACLSKSFHGLRFTSGAALACLVPFVAAIVWRALAGILLPPVAPARAAPLAGGATFDGLFVAAPLLASALCCHFSMLDIDAEMQPRHRGRTFAVIHVVALAVIPATYGAVALSGVALFGAAAAENVLTQFHGDAAMQVARGVLSLTNALRMPLMVMPLRRTLCDALRSGGSSKVAAAAEGRLAWLLALALLALSAAAACQLEVLTRVMGLLGGTCGVLGCYCLPGMMHLRAPSSGVPTWRTRLGRAAAVGAIAIGGLVAAATAATWA